MSVSKWVERQNQLLDLEREAETSLLEEKISSLSARECQKEGFSLLNLNIEGTSSAMFGRCAIALSKLGGAKLDSSFKVGDEVVLYNPKLRGTSENDDATVWGLVSKVTFKTITIVVDDFDQSYFDPPLRMDLRPNNKTYEKMKSALLDVEAAFDTSTLVRLLFSDAEPSKVFQRTSFSSESLINRRLNSSQVDAIRCGLSTPAIALIHGPPGTGKTSTLTELVLQAIRDNQKVLVCAPSNIAVDTILSRLAADGTDRRYETSTNKVLSATSDIAVESGDDSSSGCARLEGKGMAKKKSAVARKPINMIRLGHPARLSERVLSYSLDYQIKIHEGTEIVEDVRKEVDHLRKELFSCRSMRSSGTGTSKKTKNVEKKKYASKGEWKAQRAELRVLTKEVRAREKSVVERIIGGSSVVLCTCVGASSNLLKDVSFDLVVIDEAAQGLEAACWIPMLKADRCVLAGDHCQLPPTIKSSEAERSGLGHTIFEKLIEDERFSGFVNLLNVQYRMNSLISDWSSNQLYGGRVHSHSSVASHTLATLPGIKSAVHADLKSIPVLLLIDTSGCDMSEDEQQTGMSSHSNKHEAQLVYQHVCSLVRGGVSPQQIGVITPYNGQLELLKSLLLREEQTESNQEIQAMITTSSLTNGNNSSDCNFSDGVAADERPLSLEGIEVRSIDGFQGGEKECIVMSLVRSNDQRSVGFLSDKRRINVGVTRARRHLAVICDSDTVSSDAFMKTLINHLSDHGEHLSALEYADIDNSVVSAGGDHCDHKQYYPIGNHNIKTSSLKDALSTENTKASQKNGSAVGTEKVNIKQTTGSSFERQSVFSTTEANNNFNTCNNHGSRHLSSRQVCSDDERHARQRQLPIPVLANLFPLPATSTGIDNDKASPRVMRFPAYYNAHQRLRIHEQAELLKLFHRSCGEESTGTRYIEVSNYPFLEAMPSTNVEIYPGDNANENQLILENNPSAETSLAPEGLSSRSNDRSILVMDTTDVDRVVTTIDIDEIGTIINSSSSSAVSECTGEDTILLQKAEDCVVPTDKMATIEVGSPSSKSTATSSPAASAQELVAQAFLARRAEKAEMTARSVAPPSISRNGVKKHSSKRKDKNSGELEKEEVDEDDLLNAAILENQRIAKYNQYRISSQPLPNPDKVKAKQKLHSSIKAAENARATASAQQNETSKIRHQKVDKKPKKSFGGGKVGGGAGVAP